MPRDSEQCIVNSEQSRKLARFLRFTSNFFKVKHGFTLVEFLVVLGILSISVGSTLLFLTSTLKGSNQANITAEVKQNGQVVLDSLERQIRNATYARRVGPNVLSLKLQDSSYLFISCFAPSGTVSNGWIGAVANSDGAIPGGGYQSITNNIDTISGINVETCSISVVEASQGSLNPDIVTIVFTASQGVAAPSRRDFQARVPFKTTISLRRY